MTQCELENQSILDFQGQNGEKLKCTMRDWRSVQLQIAILFSRHFQKNIFTQIEKLLDRFKQLRLQKAF
jgi:hypothetical protein